MNKELYDLGFKVGSSNVLSQHQILTISDALHRGDKNKALEIILKAFMRLEMTVPKELFDSLDNYLVAVNFIFGLHNGQHSFSTNFSNFISLSDASKKYNKAESTLRENIRNGKFTKDVDCKLFGKTWVFNINALEREYGVWSD
ncbi:hypothetical protein Q3304_08575 [Clostridioides sp. GD02377]|uniref:hypothetical protein n=1 Tax=unclassified Clostridioides TaxID=2635829 RepID=UPI0038A811B2